MNLRAGLVLAVFLGLATAAGAQTPAAESQTPKPGVGELLRVSRMHLQRGEECLARGDTDCARREFDSAVDDILGSGTDVRSDPLLLAGWREILDTIVRHETAPLVSNERSTFWKAQSFDGRPTVDHDTEQAGVELLNAGSFQQKFGELQRRFRTKYDREITLTGADHAEHRRLYGIGSAYDIRVRDLTREQVSFIISNGRNLGLRIKDFSTWESVAAHNARTRLLGRPLDTLATGIHIHIDRMAEARSMSPSEKAIVKSELREKSKRK